MKLLFAAILTAIFLFSCSAFAADKGTFSTKPTLNQGKKWRIGYYEGGEYYDYKGWFIATIAGLMDTGWIEKATIPIAEGEYTTAVWNWLATNMKSDYIAFVKDAHYSAKWDDKLRAQMTEEIIERLNNQKDIDLMLAFGTWAGKDLANNRHSTPTLVLSASDAVGAGIIKSIEDSGFDHINAHVDPSLYERQILIFHDVINFKKLGVAYENTVNGKSYAAIDTINKIAKKKGFKVVSCFTQSDIADQDAAGASVLKCMEKLCGEVDAVYVTQQGGVNSKTIPQIVDIANKNRIPTFSQSGSQEVQAGLFMSISNSGFKYVGQFHASLIAKVFNGAKPGQLDQVFEGPPKVAINLKTAQLIGFDPPMVLLGATDEIYK
ncbi:ABC transporter substrate binding protein [uncultured Desulfobacter sp.]|uniref:ABC transporter substrate-binding protein n=1 Tax=uncultured Desulfobacter sp. TaxID=240139 RepID=UPI002AA6F188|nr:ABC transporter substrate binding protein [uncultured Desulfobacter sp.]